MESNNSRIEYIDSIKGIACMFVFIGHYYYGLYSSTSKEYSIFPWIIQEHNAFTFLYNGTFCVALFCFISGYFSKECKSIKDILYNSIKRYIRLAIPILILGILFYLVRNTVSFNSCDTVSDLIGSTWIKSIGRRRNTLLAVVANSLFGVLILGKSGISSQLWMLRPLLVGQIAFFVFSYCNYVQNKFVRNAIRILIVLFCLGWQYPCLAAFSGGLFHKYRKDFDHFITPDMAVALGGIALLLGHFKVYSIMPDITIGTIINLEVAAKIQVFLALLVMSAVVKDKKVQQLLSAEILQKLGKLSFPIYLLHVLFIGTLSCWIIEKTYVRLGYPLAYFLAEILTVLTVLAVSKVWNSTIDVWCNKMVYLICSRAERLVYGESMEKL